jgi:hypothetical protein
LAAKPADLALPQPEDVKNMPIPAAEGMDVDTAAERKTTCPVFEETGECRCVASVACIAWSRLILPSADTVSGAATSVGMSATPTTESRS